MILVGIIAIFPADYIFVLQPDVFLVKPPYLQQTALDLAVTAMLIYSGLKSGPSASLGRTLELMS